MVSLRLAAAGAACGMFLFVTSRVHADYYIDSAAGNDSNPGTSPEQAWQSLSPASRASGTVRLKAGGQWESSGLMLSNVTYTTYGEGPRPLINVTGGGFGGIMLQSNAVFEGIKVRASSGTGISISGSNNVVRNCEVDASNSGMQMGIGVNGPGNLITGNYIHDLSGMTGDSGDMNTSGGAEAIMVMASDNEISYNTAVNCWGPNQTLGGAEGGCYEIVNGQARSVVENVVFHHNYCERSVGLFEACSGNFRGTDKIQENHGIIRNVTLAYNLAVDAMWLYLLQPVNTDFSNMVFEHNTLVHTPANEEIPQRGANSFGLLVNTDQGYTFELQPGNITVRNNLFVTVGGGSAMFSPPPAGDHYNNMFSPAFPMGYSQGPGEVAVSDPGLTETWRLTAQSPAIDQGSPQAVAQWVDYDGNPVPCGNGRDIGASEYCEGVGGSSAAGGSVAAGGVASGAGGAANSGTPGAGGAVGSGEQPGTAGTEVVTSGGAPGTGAGTIVASGGDAPGSGTTVATTAPGSSGSLGQASTATPGAAAVPAASTTGSGEANRTGTQSSDSGAPPLASDDSGCGCQLPRTGHSGSGLVGLLGVVGFSLLRRRFRR